MLNANDQATFLAVRELKRSIRESKKPLVFWIGAGASKWLDYPLWKDLARELRREFSRYVGTFDNAEALKLIKAHSFPRFFQYCRDLDRARYYQFLTEAFLPRVETPLYQRFTDALGKIEPLHVLTTNIDEALEQRLSGAGVFQRSDLSGCVGQLQSGKSFIAKLHGSRSAIESAVFTYDEYEKLKEEAAYLNTLRVVFTMGTVVFLGYSLSDQYVIDLLSDNAKDMSLFGAGPHFVVSADFKGATSLRQISYSLKRFPDHRSALTVLDLVRQIQTRSRELSGRLEAIPAESKSGTKALKTESAYFISDFLPPETWNTWRPLNSQTSQVQRE